jgi:type I restriction enzyme, S subunit
MKLVNFDNPVMSTWFELNGSRLDSKPYLSGSIEAKTLLTKLGTPKEPLYKVTQDIFNGPRFARVYVEDPEYGVPFLGSTDILKTDLSLTQYISKKLVEHYPELTLQEGWTLITCSGTIGRMTFSRADMVGMAGSQHFMRVVPDPDKILPGYLYAYLSSRFGVAQVIEGTYGSIIQHIEPHHIEDLPVPRLGKDIETNAHNLISQASALRTKALNLLYLSGKELLIAVGLVELPESREVSRPLISVINSIDLKCRFEGTFYSPLALDAERKLKQANCEVLPLGSKNVTKNLFKPPIFKRMWVESQEYGPPFVSGNDIYRIAPAPERFVSKKFKDLESYLLRKGWVVFQAAGQLNGVFGWPIIVNSHLDSMFCADDVFRVVPHSDSDAGFIYAYLRTNYGQRLLKRQAYGYSIPRVVAEHVEQVLIPWPDEHVRRVIGSKVVQAWEDLATAIQIEANAVQIVEEAIKVRS